MTLERYIRCAGPGKGATNVDTRGEHATPLRRSLEPGFAALGHTRSRPPIPHIRCKGPGSRATTLPFGTHHHARIWHTHHTRIWHTRATLVSGSAHNERIQHAPRSCLAHAITLVPGAAPPENESQRPGVDERAAVAVQACVVGEQEVGAGFLLGEDGVERVEEGGLGGVAVTGGDQVEALA